MKNQFNLSTKGSFKKIINFIKSLNLPAACAYAIRR